jgi:hypothetical protein
MNRFADFGYSGFAAGPGASLSGQILSRGRFGQDLRNIVFKNRISLVSLVALKNKSSGNCKRNDWNIYLNFTKYWQKSQECS